MKGAYVAAGAEAYVPFSRTPSNIGGRIRVLTRPFFRTYGADARLHTQKIFPSLSAWGRKAIGLFLEVAGTRGVAVRGPESGAVAHPSPP
jgi:hypothetical protein